MIFLLSIKYIDSLFEDKTRTAINENLYSEILKKIYKFEISAT